MLPAIRPANKEAIGGHHTTECNIPFNPGGPRAGLRKKEPAKWPTLNRKLGEEEEWVRPTPSSSDEWREAARGLVTEKSVR